jgi:hypothetical protein
LLAIEGPEDLETDSVMMSAAAARAGHATSAW